jgi:hypothetical protein
MPLAAACSAALFKAAILARRCRESATRSCGVGTVAVGAAVLCYARSVTVVSVVLNPLAHTKKAGCPELRGQRLTRNTGKPLRPGEYGRVLGLHLWSCRRPIQQREVRQGVATCNTLGCSGRNVLNRAVAPRRRHRPCPCAFFAIGRRRAGVTLPLIVGRVLLGGLAVARIRLESTEHVFCHGRVFRKLPRVGNRIA